MDLVIPAVVAGRREPIAVAAGVVPAAVDFVAADFAAAVGAEPPGDDTRTADFKDRERAHAALNFEPKDSV